MQTESGFELIQNILRERDFDLLSSDYWQEVILSLIREDERHSAAVENHSLPAWVEELPSLRVCTHVVLEGSRMESGEIAEVATILEEELSTGARRLFGEGLTDLADKTHRRLQRNEIGSDPLYKLVIINGMFERTIGAHVVERIVFDDYKVPVEIRSILAHDLVGRDFSNSVSPQFWEKLRGQVPQEPKLAGAVIDWLTSEDRPEEALSILLTIRSMEDDDLSFGGLDWSVREALKEALKRPENPYLGEVLSELPKWAVEFILDDGVLPLLSPEEQGRIRKFLPKR